MEKMLKFSGFEKMYETYGFVFEADVIMPEPTKPQDSVVDPKTGLAKEKTDDILAAFGTSGKMGKDGKEVNEEDYEFEDLDNIDEGDPSNYATYDYRSGGSPSSSSSKKEDDDEEGEVIDEDDEISEEDFNFDLDLEHDLLDEADESTEDPKSKLVLKPGDKGDLVKKMQDALGVDRTGVFDKQTEEEVIEFKKENGFKKADPVVGAFAYRKMLRVNKKLKGSKLKASVASFVKDLTNLRNPKKAGASVGKKFIKINDKGGLVKKAQDALGLDVTGTFDKEMEEEVKEFKEENKFKSVDGVIGAIAYRKMLRVNKRLRGSKLKAAVAEFEKMLGGGKAVSKTPAKAAVVKPGAKGENVKIVQDLVGAKPTGVFDKATEAKVKEFQTKNGIKPTTELKPEVVKAMLVKTGLKGEDLKKAEGIYTQSKDGKKIAGLSPVEAFRKQRRRRGKRGFGKRGILKNGLLYWIFETMTIVTVNNIQYVVAIPRKDASTRLAKLQKHKRFASKFGWILLANKAAGKALVYTTKGTALVTKETASAMVNITASSFKYAKPGMMSCLSSVFHGLGQVQKWNRNPEMSKQLSAIKVNAGGLWTGYIRGCSQALKASASGMFALLCAMRASLAPAGKNGELPSKLALDVLKPAAKPLGLNWDSAKNTADAKLAGAKALNTKSKGETDKILKQIISNQQVVKANSKKAGQNSLKVVEKFGKGPKAGLNADIIATDKYLTAISGWTKGGLKNMPGSAATATAGKQLNPGGSVK